MEVVSFYVSSSIKTYSIFFFFYEPNTVYIYLSLRPPFYSAVHLYLTAVAAFVYVFSVSYWSENGSGPCSTRYGAVYLLMGVLGDTDLTATQGTSRIGWVDGLDGRWWFDESSGSKLHNQLPDTLAAVTREEHPANTQRTTNNEPTSSSSGRERGFPYLPIVDQYEILDSFAPLSLSTFIALKYVKWKGRRLWLRRTRENTKGDWLVRERNRHLLEKKKEREGERERDQFLHPSRALDPFRRDISIERIVSFCPSEHSINILHMLSSATHIPVSHRFGRKRQSHDAIIFHPTPTLVCISPYSYFWN